QRLEVLGATGDVDRVVIIPFDLTRSQEEPADFVRTILIEDLDTQLVVVGEDFHFGRKRAGTVDLLRQLGSGWGFETVGLGLIEIPGVEGAVSSTAIRERVADGDVEGAARLLGRPFELRGTVVTGDRRGRELGYPTANLGLDPELLLPGAGIYAGWYRRQST